MRILVAVASRHGATREIGEALAEVMREAGHDVDVADPDEVETVEPYGAVLLGSSVYVGRWAASARAMVDRLAVGLSVRPLWLFSSGPVGVPSVPAGEAEEVPSLMARLGARGHRVFAGRLDKSTLALAERAVAALFQAPEGDFRQWPVIRDWGRAIAIELHEEESRRIRLVH
jgi:menaquinone-dependent protoporphyrinogen oxidase